MRNSPLLLLRSDVPAFIAFVLALVAGITFHEFSHAAVATLQGDSTARSEGRLTLNPLSHLDPIGSIFLLIGGFGWGRPVPFTPSRMRSRRVGAALVGLAGPAANLVLALLAAGLIKLGLGSWAAPDTFAWKFLVVLLELNVVLCVFNLIPIPPLDGSRLLSILLPPQRQGIVYFLDQYGIFLLIALLFLAPGFLTPLFVSMETAILRLFGLLAA